MTLEAAPEAASIRVLVVEDDELVRRMLVRVLERRGFVTHEASDGGSALALVEQHEVDVVLLDNGLPDIAGTDVLAALRESPASATLPVILVTGQADIEARVGGLQAGADDYLVKPVNMDELVARVHAQIRGRDAWRSQEHEVLHERAELAAALAAIPSGGGPREIAERLLGVLAGLPGVASTGAAELGFDGAVTVLAATGGFWSNETAPEIDPLVVQELRQTVADGTVALPPTLADLVTASTHHGVIATPITAGARLVAIVLLATSARPGIDERSTTLEVLSAAIDLSPVMQRLLGPELDVRQGSRSVSSRLEQVIGEQMFHPVFQRLVELDTGRTTGYEALTRFDDGIPPDQRFAEAANAGHGLDLELATLGAALDAAARLAAGRYLSINVSASLLTSDRFPPMLERARGRPLVLELTEHERIDDYGDIRRVFEALGDDLRWSVDDAGSGWASLRHVFALRPHFVKLDRTWVSGIDGDRARQALILGVGRFVEELDGDLVAEGIETAEELEALTRLGIRYGQGYLLGRPAPIDEAIAAG